MYKIVVGAKYWNDLAYDSLQKAITREQTLNTNKAKNVVFFVGDGMGITTVTAARILKGQLEGDHGEETYLEWDKFPSVALSKVTIIITSRTYTLKQLLQEIFTVLKKPPHLKQTWGRFHKELGVVLYRRY